MALGVAAIASTMGGTADEEHIADEITEDLLEVLKKDYKSSFFIQIFKYFVHFVIKSSISIF